MRAVLLFAAILASTAQGAAATGRDAASETEFLTRDGALLCVSPRDMKEVAAARSDPARLRALRCVKMEGGIPVRRIRSDRANALHLWEVTVDPDQPDPISAWGTAGDFLWRDGTPVEPGTP